MFRRFLLLLLIALLPLQGVAASFMAKCSALPGESGERAALSVPAAEHEMTMAGGEMPCHQHEADGALVGTPLDQGCCHHLAVAIPQIFSLPGAALARGPAYPAIVSSFTDHLPDRLQRPPPSLAI